MHINYFNRDLSETYQTDGQVNRESHVRNQVLSKVTRPIFTEGFLLLFWAGVSRNFFFFFSDCYMLYLVTLLI